MAKAHYLQDKNGEKFYPFAHADATYDKNGNTVGNRLDNIEENMPTTATDVGAISMTLKGANNGVAELDANGKVPSSQLPSYVDDVIEGYYNNTNDRFYSDSAFNTLITPESGKSWVDISTNKSYRWTGSVYTRVDEGVQLGETSSTAYRGDRGKIAYDHSQSTHARTDATSVSGSTTNGNIKINDIETNVYTHPGSGTNPHGTTASDVGLGNVPNVTTNNQTPTFTEATTRSNIVSGETLAVILGKIKKFFTDLKTVAFTGSYNDLTNKPTIPTATSQLTNDSGFITSAPVTSVAGKTGTVNLSKSDVGLGNVDNTSDVNKPISTAVQTALNSKLSIGGGIDTLSNITGTARIGQFSENIFNTDFENDDGLYMFIPWGLTSTTSNQGAFVAWDDESASMYHGWCDNSGSINSYKIYDDSYHPAADNKLPLAGGTMTGDILTNQTIRPTTSGSGNIGTSSYRFGTGYINTLNSTTVAASSNVTINGNNAWHAGNLNFSLSGTTLTITTS